MEGFGYSPSQMSNVSGAVQIASTYESTLILRNDGAILTCGDNYLGQLGVGYSVMG